MTNSPGAPRLGRRSFPYFTALYYPRATGRMMRYSLADARAQSHRQTPDHLTPSASLFTGDNESPTAPQPARCARTGHPVRHRPNRAFHERTHEYRTTTSSRSSTLCRRRHFRSSLWQCLVAAGTRHQSRRWRIGRPFPRRSATPFRHAALNRPPKGDTR